MAHKFSYHPAYDAEPALTWDDNGEGDAPTTWPFSVQIKAAATATVNACRGNLLHQRTSTGLI